MEFQAGGFGGVGGRYFVVGSAIPRSRILGVEKWKVVSVQELSWDCGVVLEDVGLGQSNPSSSLRLIR